VKTTIDKGTIGGLAFAIAGLGTGLMLEGVKLPQVLQPTAALIVFGGTLGAVMVQFPLRIVIEALRQLMEVLLHSDPEPDNLVQNLLRFAYKARKEGIVSLDAELDKIRDPFLKESLMLAIDGVKPVDLRKMM
jgi:chemotaxis protein MotA